MPKHRKRSKRNTGRLTGTALILLLVIGAALYGWHGDRIKLGKSARDTTQSDMDAPSQTGHSQHKTDRSPPPIDKSLKRPLAFLVVGIDERKNDPGRTDTIIVFTANPDERTIKMVSIPRDTKTVLADVSQSAVDKINHAYSRGDGMPSTKKTVEHFLGIPIDYTVSINMRGFAQLIDTFGGVTIDVPRNFSIAGHHYTKGPMTLDGEAALAYVRERGSSNDFARNARQQQVVRALIDKSARFSTIAKISDILSIIGRNVKTNLTPLKMLHLQRLYGDVSPHDIERLALTGRDEWSDAYYFIADDARRREVSETLRAHLQLD